MKKALVRRVVSLFLCFCMVIGLFKGYIFKISLRRIAAVSQLKGSAFKSIK